MAAGDGSGGGGGRHWLADEAPGFRSGMLEKLTIRLAPLYQPRYEPYSQEPQIIVANFEEGAFKGTKSKDEYIKNISNKLVSSERTRSEEQKRRMQSHSQLQWTNSPQALQGGNSSVMPEAASPRPNSQPKISGSCTPNTQIEIEQKHPGMMANMDRCLNFQPSTAIATIGQGVQPGPQPMQSIASQSQIQYPARQPQALNIGRQQQQLTRMNQQTLGAKQQEMDMQRYHMLGAQQGDASKTQVSQLGGRNVLQDGRQTDLLHSPFKACKSEPMTPPLQQISGAQQSSFLRQNSQSPVTMGRATECDIMEKMFCQIKSWKDAYYSQFVELGQRFAVRTLTKEELSALPAAKAHDYRKKAEFVKRIRNTLNFLLLRKSDVREGFKLEFPKYERFINDLLGFMERRKSCNAKVNTGCQLQNCGEQPQVINLTGNASPITGGKSRQQKQSAYASILQSRQTSTARTPPAHQHNNHNHLLGIASPSSSTSSPGTLQSWSTSMLEFLTPSPVARPVVAPDSPCAPIMSTFSKDVDSISPFLLHDNVAAAPPKANSSKQVTPTKQTTSVSPLQEEIATGQSEGQARGGDKTSVTKKPIDRLIDALRSSSPTALRNSANSIWSVLSISDIVPPGKIGTVLDCKSSQQQQFGGSKNLNKMKRVFNTTSCSESRLSGSIDRSCMSFECDTSDSGSSGEISIKRQKTQNANDALLEEIESVNSTLIDTVITICDDYRTHEIASCSGGTTIKLSYSAVSCSPTEKLFFTTSETSLVLPTKLFIPPDYPSSSPVLVNREGDEVLRKNSCAITASVDVAFRHVLGDLPERRSIMETAKAWDTCVRKAVTEFAQRHGGGTVSSMVGRWERCVAA